MNYSIRQSKRAKNISLRISYDNKIEVVVPYGYNGKEIPKFVEKQRTWIVKTQKKIAAQLKESKVVQCNKKLPQVINIFGGEEVWQVEYRPTTAKYISFKEDIPQKSLIIYGNIGDKNHCINVINKWLHDYADRFLGDRLRMISNRVDLNFMDYKIRNQKRRWGSCSSKKNINLNRKLLFLSLNLIDYVLIHELCHTIHMNHSKKFWQLGESFDSNFKKHDTEVSKHAWVKFVPWWA